MAVASRVMGVVELVGAICGEHDVMVDSSGACSFVSKVGGVIKRLVMHLALSSDGVCVVCDYLCNWVSMIVVCD